MDAHSLKLERDAMNLNPHRPWITPLVMGAFLLLTVTGVLMFFHLDSRLNKLAYEWLSWALLAGVLLHVGLNVNAFKRYLSQPTARVVMGVFVLALGLSFVPLGGAKNEPGFDPPVHALAQVAGTSTDDIKARLQAQGLNVTSEQQLVADLVGNDLRQQIGALTPVLSASGR